MAIAAQFDGLLYQIIYAPSLAAIPYVAQNIGAGNIDRVKKTVLRSILITTAFGVTFGSLSAIFSAELSSIMSTTPAIIKYSQQRMIIVSSTYFLFGINEIMGGVLKGNGQVHNSHSINACIYVSDSFSVGLFYFPDVS